MALSLNSLAITKLLPVLTLLQWLSTLGGVKGDQKIDKAITKKIDTNNGVESGAWKRFCTSSKGIWQVIIVAMQI